MYMSLVSKCLIIQVNSMYFLERRKQLGTSVRALFCTRQWGNGFLEGPWMAKLHIKYLLSEGNTRLCVGVWSLNHWKGIAKNST